MEAKIEEMKNVEKNINNLKYVLSKFTSSAHSYQKYFKELSESIKLVYGKNNICSNLGNDIADAHSNIEQMFEDMMTYVADINKSTNDWSNLFENAKNCLKEREEFRKKFERYIDKLNKLNKIKIDKTKKNCYETKDSEKLIKVKFYV